MTKKHRYILTAITITTFIHMIFSTFYPLIYGYFNTHNHLPSFLFVVLILRLVLLVGIALGGFIALREQKKFLPIYLILFLFNLLIPYLFNH